MRSSNPQETIAMSQQMVKGFVWCTFPDVLGLDDDAATEPGHPFTPSPGKVQVPEEVLYYRPANPADSGFFNEKRANTYLVVTKMQHHPRCCPGWESEPAVLAGNFKTADGKVKLTKIVQHHKRHAGDLLECELKIEGD
jgi:hypothetical protein